MRSAFSRISLTSLLGSMALVVGAVAAPASAQDEAGELHAELGTLQGIEMMGDHHLVTTGVPGPFGDEAQRTYRTTETTGVEGLGSIMSVDEITARSNGSIVIVTFARDGQELVAENIRFTGDDDVRVTQGTVLEVEGDDTLVLEADGERQRLDLDYGYGATVDSPRGLGEPEDLQTGQEVTVYYADPPEPLSAESEITGYARLIVQTPS